MLRQDLPVSPPLLSPIHSSLATNTDNVKMDTASKNDLTDKTCWLQRKTQKRTDKFKAIFNYLQVKIQ